MTYYVLVETATGIFNTWANRRTIDLFTSKQQALDKFATLKDAFMYEQEHDDYIDKNEMLFSVTRPCEDCCYWDNSVYSLEIREIEL